MQKETFRLQENNVLAKNILFFAKRMQKKYSFLQKDFLKNTFFCEKYSLWPETKEMQRFGEIGNVWETVEIWGKVGEKGGNGQKGGATLFF